MNKFFMLSFAVLSAATMCAQSVEDYGIDLHLDGIQPHVIVTNHAPNRVRVGEVVLCDSVVYTVSEN